LGIVSPAMILRFKGRLGAGRVHDVHLAVVPDQLPAEPNDVADDAALAERGRADHLEGRLGGAASRGWEVDDRAARVGRSLDACFCCGCFFSQIIGARRPCL
jgi:hypothetical protein